MHGTDFLFFALAILFCGTFAGMLAGLFGIGGGIIMVPILFSLFKAGGSPPDVAMHVAIGTSLMTIVPTSFISMRSHWRHGAVDTTILKQWGPPTMVGAVLGGLAANHMSGSSLTLIFGFFVLAVALVMGLTPANLRANKHLAQTGVQRGLAFVIGLISSLVGVGGGSLSVPTLVICRMPMHRAIGTSAGLGFLISLPAAVVFLFSQLTHGAAMRVVMKKGVLAGSFGNVDLLAFVLLVPATMLVAPLGAKLAHRLPPANLQRGFAVFLMVIALRMLYAGLV
jgi:uncharacterized membrane protein YfcA